MRCPKCGAEASLHAPAYAAWQTPIFKCYSCNVYGQAFHSDTPEGWAESDGSRAASRSNAIEIRASRHSWDGPSMTGRMECSRCGQRATYEEHRDRLTEACAPRSKP